MSSGSHNVKVEADIVIIAQKYVSVNDEDNNSGIEETACERVLHGMQESVALSASRSTKLFLRKSLTSSNVSFIIFLYHNSNAM